MAGHLKPINQKVAMAFPRIPCNLTTVRAHHATKKKPGLVGPLSPGPLISWGPRTQTTHKIPERSQPSSEAKHCKKRWRSTSRARAAAAPRLSCSSHERHGEALADTQARSPSPCSTRHLAKASTTRAGGSECFCFGDFSLTSPTSSAGLRKLLPGPEAARL